jgi:hypothetical protein
MYRAEAPDGTAPQAGEFTFAIAPQTSSAIGEGFGVGTVRVTEAGGVTVSGTMPNGTAFSESTALYSQQYFPIVPRFGSRDGLVGWMTFSTNHNTFEGSVRWISDMFTNAFGEAGQVTGLRFIAPASSLPVLSWTNGFLQLAGGDIEEALEIPVSLDGANIVVGTNDVNLQLTSGTDGQITGTFTHPASQAVAPVNAVFLQESNIAVGFFPGTNRSGALRLRAAP